MRLHSKLRLSKLLPIMMAVFSILYFAVMFRYSIIQINRKNVKLTRDTSRIDASTPAFPKPTKMSVADLAKRASSVDYMACCGAGHRTSKTAEANYLSKVLGLGLRTFWGFCDNIEVFNYLFGPQPASEAIISNKTNSFLRVNNDVPGFVKLIRNGPNSVCTCSMEKAREDVKFYGGLRYRFRGQDKVTTFRRTFFANKTVIGMHIRAGNGETGDFAGRNRAIADIDVWLDRVTTIILEQQWKASVCFLATDTPSLIPRIQERLGSTIEVVHLEQDRPDEGSGVMFGERGKVATSGMTCLKSWEDTFTDMMLLSHADVVISARPSSFTQSLPMSLVLAKPKAQRKIRKSFCEMNRSATEMRCYEDFKEWCCEGETSFALDGIQKYDYLRMPSSILQTKNYQLKGRSEFGGCIPRPDGWKQPCLPYNWSEFQIKTRSLRNPRRSLA